MLSLEHELDTLAEFAEFADAIVRGPLEGLAAAPRQLADAASGLVVPSGSFVAVAAADPREAIELADRLGRYVPDEADQVTLGGVPLAGKPLAEVRREILVADNDAQLFAGRLRDELSSSASDEAVAAALHAASARDVIEALPAGLDAIVAECGRSFSGGQQQRLRLARALLVDPEVLLLVEPTSAVDAHTEARIAERLARSRAGRTTVVFHHQSADARPG